MFEKKIQYSSVQYAAIKSVACPLLSYRIGKKVFRYTAVTIWNVIFENISVDIEIAGLPAAPFTPIYTIYTHIDNRYLLSYIFISCVPLW